MPESYSERGFAQYVTFTDDYGAEVRVYESSAAQIEGEDRGPWVWVLIDGGELAKGMHGPNVGHSHMGPVGARKLRDALTEWLGGVDEDKPVRPALTDEDRAALHTVADMGRASSTYLEALCSYLARRLLGEDAGPAPWGRDA